VTRKTLTSAGRFWVAYLALVAAALAVAAWRWLP
jgi:HAMP domain-containing protein